MIELNTFRDNTEVKFTKVSVGREVRIVPLAMEMEVKNGSLLYDFIMEASKFKEFENKVLTSMYPAEKQYEKLQENLVQLHKDCKGANLKITIKIELEKYE